MKKRVLGLLLAAAAITACVAFMSGCSGSNTSNLVAATVNGTDIMEDTITEDVQKFRESYSVTDADSWAEWMNNYSYTPSSVREAMIDSRVNKELEKIAAEEKGLSVEDSEVQEYVDKMKSNYSDDETWVNALQSAGFTEDSYRERIQESLLEQKVMDEVCPKTEPDDSTMLTYATSYKSYYSGAKRSAQVMFNTGDTETAQSVLDQIRAGTLSFEDAVKQYSTDEKTKDNGGDVGWDVLNSASTEYTNALKKLNVGEVSDLVTNSNGIHIIKCTEEFTAPDTLSSASELPQAFQDAIKKTVQDSQQQSDFSTWLSKYKEEKDVQINEMPAGLPYDVDMSKYNTNTNNNNSNNGEYELFNSMSGNTESGEGSTSDTTATTTDAGTENTSSSAGSDAAGSSEGSAGSASGSEGTAEQGNANTSGGQ